MKILLVEDNKSISDNIKQFFEIDNHKVDTSFSGIDAIKMSLENNYDIIILDLMLPTIDGIGFLKKVRDKINTPIIITSAKESVDTKIELFSLGALDYLVKPFDLRELEIRIKNILNKDKLNIKSGYKIDLENMSINNNGTYIDLSKTQFYILKYLYENKDKVVSRLDIIEEIWGESAIFDSDGKLDVYISNIRNKLGKEAIKTIKGVGYKFNL